MSRDYFVKVYGFNAVQLERVRELVRADGFTSVSKWCYQILDREIYNRSVRPNVQVEHERLFYGDVVDAEEGGKLE